MNIYVIHVPPWVYGASHYAIVKSENVEDAKEAAFAKFGDEKDANPPCDWLHSNPEIKFDEDSVSQRLASSW